MSHQSGFGMLTITDEGQKLARFAVAEGGAVTTDIAGHKVAFALQKAPGLDGYDIREMSSEAIAKFLASKLEGEALLADIDGEEYPDG
jgi:hypothetical protein